MSPKLNRSYIAGRIQEMLSQSTEWTEALVVFALFVFGFILLIPVDSYSLSKAYAFLAALLPETLAGLLFMALGVIGAIIILCGSIRLRRASMLVSAAIWGLLTGAFIASALTTSAIDVVFMLWAWGAYVRLGTLDKKDGH